MPGSIDCTEPKFIVILWELGREVTVSSGMGLPKAHAPWNVLSHFTPFPLLWGWIADYGVDYEIRWVVVNSGVRAHAPCFVEYSLRMSNKIWPCVCCHIWNFGFIFLCCHPSAVWWRSMFVLVPHMAIKHACAYILSQLWSILFVYLS